MGVDFWAWARGGRLSDCSADHHPLGEEVGNRLEARIGETWNPAAEGLCYRCGGEGVIDDCIWTPFGRLPLPLKECPTCGGTGELVLVEKGS